MKPVSLLLAVAVLGTGCLTCSDRAPRSAEWTKCIQDQNQMNFELTNQEIIRAQTIQAQSVVDPGPVPIPVLPPPAP